MALKFFKEYMYTYRCPFAYAVCCELLAEIAGCRERWTVHGQYKTYYTIQLSRRSTNLIKDEGRKKVRREILASVTRYLEI